MMKILEAFWNESPLFETYGLIVWSVMIQVAGVDGKTYQLWNDGINAIDFSDEGEPSAAGREAMTAKAEKLLERIKAKGEIDLKYWFEVEPRARYGTREAEREMIALEEGLKLEGY